MEDIPITEAQILGLFLESVFWGMYLITFVYCLRTLLFGLNFEIKRPSEINWPMVVITLLMCVLATLDTAVGLLHLIQAFVLYTGPGGPTEEFSNISDWINVVKGFDIILQTIMGDGMLIFRCWVVYGKSWLVIAASMLLYVGSTVTGIMILRIEGTLHLHVLITGASAIKPLITSFWILTIVQNILTTTLLFSRIWKVDQQNSQFSYSGSTGGKKKRTRLRQLNQVILESGLLYTTMAFLSFITFITNSNSTYGVSDVHVIMVGINFNLIIIRADRRATEEQTMLKHSRTLHLQALPGPGSDNSTDPKSGTMMSGVSEGMDFAAFSKMTSTGTV
ncbi:hypothetical protein B0H16DRAFT_1386994 [Mycena metata]|uniref:Uncharacterized protein n=1 Tax=Mycena metata TaxID=1033252 RepID=A0AAD7HG12_9AGAR|nr:hypothetical protein B0H16DRAFT_1386994 [Mycena metata]